MVHARPRPDAALFAFDHHHGKAGNLEIHVALGTMTRGAKDKEDEMIQKRGASEDERVGG